MPCAGWSWCRSRFLPAMGKTPPKEKRAMKVAKKGPNMKAGKAMKAMKAMKAPKAKAMKGPVKSPKSGVKAMKVPKKTNSQKKKDADAADADDDNTITTPPAEPDSQPEDKPKTFKRPAAKMNPSPAPSPRSPHGRTTGSLSGPSGSGSDGESSSGKSSSGSGSGSENAVSPKSPSVPDAATQQQGPLALGGCTYVEEVWGGRAGQTRTDSVDCACIFISLAVLLPWSFLAKSF